MLAFRFPPTDKQIEEEIYQILGEQWQDLRDLIAQERDLAADTGNICLGCNDDPAENEDLLSFGEYCYEH